MSLLSLSTDELNKLTSNSSPDRKFDVILEMIGQYHCFIGYEKQLADEVLAYLVKESSTLIKRTISQTLRNNPNIPHSIAYSLACDALKVSLPIIEFSEVLTDADLIYIIEEQNDLTKNIYITKRKNVSDKVSYSLIKTEHALVVTNLLKNDRAVIDEQGLKTIIEKFINNTIIMDQLISTRELPDELQIALIDKISTAIQEEASRKYSEYTDQAHETVKISRNLQLIERANSRVIKGESITKVVGILHDGGVLDGQLLLTMLATGNLDLFITSISTITNTREENVRTIIKNSSKLGFRMLCKRVKLLPAEMKEFTCSIVLAIVDLHTNNTELLKEPTNLKIQKSNERVAINFLMKQELNLTSPNAQPLKEFLEVLQVLLNNRD